MTLQQWLYKTNTSRSEKIRESYDFEPENYSTIWDPGEWIMALNVSWLCSVVDKGFIRPEMSYENAHKKKQMF
jgi:hypothetical protein